MDGRGGGDVLTGAGANDTLYGGGGNDTLDGGDGNDGLYGQAGDDGISGGGGDDQIVDTVGNNTISAGAGNDHVMGSGTVNGDAGDDDLSGNGTTVLRGGAGHDHLHCGTGAQRVDYNATSEDDPSPQSPVHLAEIIFGFNGADGDRLDVSTIDANLTVAGNQAFTFVGNTPVDRAGEIGLLVSGGVTYVADRWSGQRSVPADLADRRRLGTADFILERAVNIAAVVGRTRSRSRLGRGGAEDRARSAAQSPVVGLHLRRHRLRAADRRLSLIDR